MDDSGWLIINQEQDYTIEFDSLTRIESFIIFFPAGWSEEVARSLTVRAEGLLDSPSEPGKPAHFFETVTPHDDLVTPRLRRLREVCRDQQMDDGWLEQELRELLAAMFQRQSGSREQADGVQALRAATRAELYRRLCRGRDDLQAEALRAPQLWQAAQAAALSPFHFQRSFSRGFQLHHGLGPGAVRQHAIRKI